MGSKDYRFYNITRIQSWIGSYCITRPVFPVAIAWAIDKLGDYGYW